MMLSDICPNSEEVHLHLAVYVIAHNLLVEADTHKKHLIDWREGEAGGRCGVGSGEGVGEDVAVSVPQTDRAVVTH